MPYDMLNNYVQQPVVYEQPVQQEPQVSAYQQRMNDLPNAKYLGKDYQFDNWVRGAEQDGITNGATQTVMYNQRIKPLIDAARDDEIRESFILASHPDTDPQMKTEALAKLSYYMKNPDLVNDVNLKRMKTLQGMGLMENQNYSGGDIGKNILSTLGNYQEGEQWMSPDGTGDSRTQCSNWVSDVLKRSGIKGLGSANGDELMRQFGSAYHEGLDGIQAGDVLNFKDHVGIYVGNGQYVARNSSGGVHQGSMEEAVQAFGQPLGYGSISAYTGNIGGNGKYIRDPNYVSPREKYNRQIFENDRNYNLQRERLDRLVNQDALRWGNGNGRQRGLTSQAFNKNLASMRNSALNLAQLQNVGSEDDEGKKKYEAGMNKFSNDVSNLCSAFDDGSMDSVSFGIQVYNELNKTRSGLRPETLAEGVARAVFAQRGDVDARELQRAILHYVYNGGQQQSGTNSVADFRRYDNENPYQNNVLNIADSRRNSWDKAFR